MANTPASPDTIEKLAQDYAVALKDPKQPYGKWCQNLSAYLAKVRDASVDERASLEFQTDLWNSEVVAATGQGQISVDAALADPAFRRSVAERSLQQVPGNPGDALAALRAWYRELESRLGAYKMRIPRLKIFRVLATFQPRHFTTIADVGKIAKLHGILLGAEMKTDPVQAHRNVLDRLHDLLGPAPEGLDGWVERMTLAWFLYERLSRGNAQQATAPSQLTPWPAARRRRGMTAMRRTLPAVLATLDFVGDGVPGDELRAFLKQQNPALKDSSVGMNINLLRNELGVLEKEGDLLVPSEVGRCLLETGDPSTLAPGLLTRILGVDHIIVALRDEGPLHPKDLVERLQKVNPGWTTDFAPSAMLTWLRSFEVVETDPAGLLQLTERGKQWAAMIHWEPEFLEGADAEAAVETVAASSVLVPDVDPELPSLNAILERLPKGFHFSKEKLAALHAGLWSHPRRHFAILTGLSGSGKTSLARSYAQALIDLTSSPEEPLRRLRTIPVAPGWTDPSPLFGYVNPLNSGEYVKPPFLDLLLSCAKHPSKVHVAVLDEMNLSHPEQYLAPLLSGMEVGDEPLVFHSESTEVDGVPGCLDRYPRNLVLIGTVNMDETTHGLSDKVLDRATTLEFWDIDLDDYPRWSTRGLPAELEKNVRAVLGDLLRVLAPVRMHFGWRVVDDVLDFIKRSADDGVLESPLALDQVVGSKVVPKLRGYDSKQFREALGGCREVLSKHQLKRSEEKVASLVKDLEATGSARFWR